MVNDPAERQNFAVDDHMVGMTFLSVASIVFTVKHRPRRVQRTAQRPPVNPIDKPRRVAPGAVGRRERCQFAEELIAELVVGVEREHPRADDLLETIVALGCKIHEGVMNHLDLWIAS